MFTSTLTGISKQLAASNFREEKKMLLVGILPYITNKRLGIRCSEPRGGEVLQRDQSCEQYARGKESNMKYTEDAELSNGYKVTN
jgi:hypothetical protein